MVETVPGSRIFGNAVELTGDAVMADLIAKLQAAGETYRIPLFQAARQKIVSLVAATDGEPMLMRYLKDTRRPVVALLAGDTPTDRGPDGWPQARKLIRWAEHVFIHATGGQPFHYEMMVMAAQMKSRVLVIECEYRHHAAWLALVVKLRPRLPVVNLIPPPGGAHPVMPSKREMH
ncbi:hypothetical protein [Roseomonas sp. BN140053]|uniref:hypothetical protein n=1 Tax=Roseomonas sp. BN140053 TaxID=3391898 RepID=UPI0039EB7C07